MQAASRLHRTLFSASPSWGAWQLLPGANVSRALARTGVDWVVVDGEHGHISDSSMHEAVGALASAGVSPIVRLPAGEGWMVKRALDAGAHGIVVPLLETAEEARALVASAKFPPQGRRGFGSPFAPQAFGISNAQYLPQANGALVTVVQIETRRAVENAAAIAGVEGIDVLFIGPFDLSINLGTPISSPADLPQGVKEAIETVLSEAKKAGKKAGIFCTSGEQGRKFADMGFDMVNIAADFSSMEAHVGAALAKAKEGSEKGQL